MTSRTFVLLAGICIVAVNGLFMPKKRESPPAHPTPSPSAHCRPKLDRCSEEKLGKYQFRTFEATVEKIRRTSARQICNDLREHASCVAAVLSEPPCDQLLDDSSKASLERYLEGLEHFCGPRLDDVEENKNCFVSTDFYRGLNQCGMDNIGHPSNCSQEAFTSCVEALTEDNSDCGPGAVPLIHEYIEAVIYVEDVPNGQLCREENSAKNFLKQLMKRF
jgi:hypothetical protein